LLSNERSRNRPSAPRIFCVLLVLSGLAVQNAEWGRESTYPAIPGSASPVESRSFPRLLLESVRRCRLPHRDPSPRQCSNLRAILVSQQTAGRSQATCTPPGCNSYPLIQPRGVASLNRRLIALKPQACAAQRLSPLDLNHPTTHP